MHGCCCLSVLLLVVCFVWLPLELSPSQLLDSLFLSSSVWSSQSVMHPLPSSSLLHRPLLTRRFVVLCVWLLFNGGQGGTDTDARHCFTRQGSLDGGMTSPGQ